MKESSDRATLGEVADGTKDVPYRVSQYGDCLYCKEPVTEDQRITWLAGRKAVHFDCNEARVSQVLEEGSIAGLIPKSGAVAGD